MDTLVHQTQPTPWSCVHTCIAMLMGVPVQEVIDRVNRNHGLNTLQTIRAMADFGIRFAPLSMCMQSLWDGWHLVSVPSLNHPRGLHAILICWDDGEMKVLDPAIGNRYAEDGSDLMSWSDTIIAKPGGSLSYFDSLNQKTS